MSAALHLAGPEHLQALLPLVAAFQAEEGLALDQAARAAAVMPLLEGSPHGAIYLIGPTRAPIGYVCITFGWSLEFGGLDGFVDEIYIRPTVRGRGMGGEVINRLAMALRDGGMKALHLEVSTDNPRALALYKRSHFRMRAGYQLMSRKL